MYETKEIPKNCRFLCVSLSVIRLWHCHQERSKPAERNENENNGFELVLTPHPLATKTPSSLASSALWQIKWPFEEDLDRIWVCGDKS